MTMNIVGGRLRIPLIELHDEPGPLPTPCLVPIGRRATGGYGSLYLPGRDHWQIHRLIWTLAHGPIPDGLHVLHHCDNPPCANPAHLFVGTVADNMADRDTKGRQWNMSKTHCIHGHAFTPENTHVNAKGHRSCRACGRDKYHRHQTLTKR